MKKHFALVGMVAGACIIFFGILATLGAFGSATAYGGYSPYDSGFAGFGGDYYTYSVNNSAETASATRAVAENLCDISQLIRLCFGLFMMGFVLLRYVDLELFLQVAVMQKK